MASLIPSWISSYNPSAFSALTAQETYAYSQDPINWIPLFQTLANNLNAWHATNRSADISNLINPMYQGYVMNAIYGTAIPDLTTCDGLVVFSVAGFLTAAASRPNTYYNDLLTVAPVPPATLPTYSSAKMTADLTTTSGAISSEQATIKSLTGGLTGAVQGVITNMLFIDPPAPLATVTKAGIAAYIFTTLHYKAVYQNLSVSPLALPPGV